MMPKPCIGSCTWVLLLLLEVLRTIGGHLFGDDLLEPMLL